MHTLHVKQNYKIAQFVGCLMGCLIKMHKKRPAVIKGTAYYLLLQPDCKIAKVNFLSCLKYSSIHLSQNISDLPRNTTAL